MIPASQDSIAGEEQPILQPQGAEIRRPLNGRRNEQLPSIRSASHLDLNREFGERSDEIAKYFFAALIVFGLLSAICDWAGII